MRTKEITIVGMSILLSAIAMGFIFAFMTSSQLADASAPSGLPSTVSTSSQATVGPSNIVFVASSTPNCASRVISTVSKPIMLSFNDTHLSSTTQLGGTFGHVQLASTTVAYDSGIYGCAKITAYGFDASTTITITTTQ